MENIDLAANPAAGTFLEDETNRMMTFFHQGFAILPWGQPPPEIVREIDDALATEMPADKYYVRGTYNSAVSKALIKFIMHNISSDRVRIFKFYTDQMLIIYQEQHTHSLLLGGDSREEVVPGEPMLIDCSRVSDPPQPCRLGPYGYDRGEAVALLRLIRGTVRIPYYPGSQKMDKVQFQETSHDKRLAALELTLEDILCIDSDLCFDWPWTDSDGIFVLMTVSRGHQRLARRRDRAPMPVAPFHSSRVIRLLEEQASRS